MSAPASVISAVFVVSGMAWGSVAPYSHQSPQAWEQPNVSYLADTQRREEQDGYLSHERVLGENAGPALRQRLDDMSREYRMRKNHGLNTLGDELKRYQSMKGLASEIVSEAKNREISHQQGKLKSFAEGYKNDAWVKALRQPVGLAVALVAMGTGHPITVDLAEDSQLLASADVRDRTSRISLLSPLVNWNLDYIATAQAEVPESQRLLADERYRMSLGRRLPLFELQSGVSYGSTSRTMNASLSRRLVENLTCTVDAGTIQERLRLEYGISF